MITNPNIQVDPEGYLSSGGIRITDAEVGHDLLKKLRREDEVYFSTYGDRSVLVEAFDRPLIAIQVEKVSGFHWIAVCPYGYKVDFDVRKLRLDAWDRFNGVTESEIAFVFSRTAQAEFFKLLDDYTDETITVDGEELSIPEFYVEDPNAQAPTFWGDYYQKDELPPWDLDQYNPNLNGILAQLKLNKSKILVLGAGQGHDANFLAEQGHIVTAVDYSPAAQKSFTQRYPQSLVANYTVRDVFQLPPEWLNSFDLVFDHTLFCAIPPRQRKSLIQVWKKVLKPRGHLLSIFFLLTRTSGPAYGVTEWEAQQLMQKDFDFIYWSRAKNSAQSRKNKELIVYAQKK
ncbi:MAG: methyltransferase domain-containing protein [Bdellovibrionales bacterium]